MARNLRVSQFGASSQFRATEPPKPSFPSFEGVSPGGQEGFTSSALSGADFQSNFLKFMSEAGERLGKAAAEEIEKARIKIDSGDRPQNEAVNLKNTAPNATPSERFANNQMRAMLPNGQDLAKAASVIWMIGLRTASFVANVPAMSTEIAEGQRRFAAVSPSMLGVFNESAARGMQRDIVSGEKLAPTARQLLQQLDKFRGSAAQVTDKLTEIKNILGAEILGAINSVTGPLVEWLLGKRQHAEGLPMLTKFRDMASNEGARNENRLAHAAKAAPRGWGVHQDPRTGAVEFIPPPDFIGPPLPPWGPKP